MIKVETCKLEGAALDWAVAQAVGLQVIFQVLSEMIDTSTQDKPSSIETVLGADVYYLSGDMSLALYSPSTLWEQGGPIIEATGIYLSSGFWGESRWVAKHDSLTACFCGETALIATCRAIVAVNIGDEVEVPEALPHG